MGDIIQVVITSNYITTLTELHEKICCDLHNRMLLDGYEQYETFG